MKLTGKLVIIVFGLVVLLIVLVIYGGLNTNIFQNLLKILGLVQVAGG